MIPVNVSNLSISNVGFVLLLKSQADARTLPIFIGVPEAQAIALFLNGTTPPRPMTHDLMKNLLDILEGRLERVEVSGLDSGTFFGRLVLSFEGQQLEVDARPSDAVALALRCHAPIFVDDEVMSSGGVVLDQPEEESEPAVPEEAPPLKPIDRLRNELEKAIREERYEDAARLRDEIQKARSAN